MALTLRPLDCGVHHWSPLLRLPGSDLPHVASPSLRFISLVCEARRLRGLINFAALALTLRPLDCCLRHWSPPLRSPGSELPHVASPSLRFCLARVCDACRLRGLINFCCLGSKHCALSIAVCIIGRPSCVCPVPTCLTSLRPRSALSRPSAMPVAYAVYLIFAALALTLRPLHCCVHHWLPLLRLPGSDLPHVASPSLRFVSPVCDVCHAGCRCVIGHSLAFARLLPCLTLALCVEPVCDSQVVSPLVPSTHSPSSRRLPLRTHQVQFCHRLVSVATARHLAAPSSFVAGEQVTSWARCVFCSQSTVPRQMSQSAAFPRPIRFAPRSPRVYPALSHLSAMPVMPAAVASLVSPASARLRFSSCSPRVCPALSHLSAMPVMGCSPSPPRRHAATGISYRLGRPYPAGCP